MHMPDPTFPPLLNGIAVRRTPGPFDRAMAAVAAGRAGAGDLFWSRSTHELLAAIVLEPEVGTEQAMHMQFAACLAFGDAFGALAPPEIGVFFRWPAVILVNGARVGVVRTGIPPDATAEAVPDWLVVGIEVAIRSREPDVEPGLRPEQTTLHDEGCVALTRTQLVESYSRHFLVWVHTWEDEGFRPLHDAWLTRAEAHEKEIVLSHRGTSRKGTFLGLDELGNLLLKDANGTVESLSVFATVERFAGRDV